MTELFWIMIKGDQKNCWGNRSFTTEQEALEYLRANIVYPVSDTKFRLVETVAKYDMKFEIKKDTSNW